MRVLLIALLAAISYAQTAFAASGLGGEISVGRRDLQACNYQCYLDRYPDLQRAFGKTNTAKAAQHYNTQGVREGRDCTCPGETDAVTGALPRGQQAIRLASATGAKIDDSAAVTATKNWLKEKQVQMKFLDDLQKQADGLGELAKQIDDHRNQYKSAVDRKNQADSALEEESVNYLASELMRLKKKVDQTLEERDSIVDKYVPELKVAMKKRENQITEFWKGKEVDFKKELESINESLQKLKEAQAKEIAEKEKELDAERKAGAEKIQETNVEAEKKADELRANMAKQAKSNTEKMKMVNEEMKARDDKWNAQINEAEDKNSKQAAENNNAVAAANKKNEEQIANLEGKYQTEIADIDQKLQKTRANNKKRVDDLVKKKGDLQKEVTDADAVKTNEIADLKKKEDADRQAMRKRAQEQEAALVQKLNGERNAALAAQAEANKNTLANVQAQAEQRLQNFEESRKNEANRAKATQDRLKEQITAEQARTDQANDKLHAAQTQLDDLKTNMATVAQNTMKSNAALAANANSAAGTSAEETEVAAFSAQYGGINVTYVGLLVALNLGLAAIAGSYYVEGKKTNVESYQAGLLEDEF